MTRAEFAARPTEQRVSAYITFQYGAGRADIHHEVRDASVGLTLAMYPSFDSIEVDRVIAPRANLYALACEKRRSAHA